MPKRLIHSVSDQTYAPFWLVGAIFVMLSTAGCGEKSNSSSRLSDGSSIYRERDKIKDFLSEQKKELAALRSALGDAKTSDGKIAVLLALSKASSLHLSVWTGLNRVEEFIATEETKEQINKASDGKEVAERSRVEMQNMLETCRQILEYGKSEGARQIGDLSGVDYEKVYPKALASFRDEWIPDASDLEKDVIGDKKRAGFRIFLVQISPKTEETGIQEIGVAESFSSDPNYVDDVEYVGNAKNARAFDVSSKNGKYQGLLEVDEVRGSLEGYRLIWTEKIVDE